MVPSNEILHRFHKDSDEHTLFELDQISHKCETSIKWPRNQTGLKFEWGIHLIESVDKFRTWALSGVVAIVSQLIAIIYWLGTGDLQTAFTVATWVTAVQTIFVGLVLASWEQS